MGRCKADGVAARERFAAGARLSVQRNPTLGKVPLPLFLVLIGKASDEETEKTHSDIRFAYAYFPR
jgi:hypothetical protein